MTNNFKTFPVSHRTFFTPGAVDIARNKKKKKLAIKIKINHFLQQNAIVIFGLVSQTVDARGGAFRPRSGAGRGKGKSLRGGPGEGKSLRGGVGERVL